MNGRQKAVHRFTWKTSTKATSWTSKSWTKSLRSKTGEHHLFAILEFRTGHEPSGQKEKPMTPSLAAVLARFNGNVSEALEYCERIAYAHPQLTVEYRVYREALIERMVEKK
jgi:hypothetical protein